MTEFKVGDRVQVVSNANDDFTNHIGATGTISYVATFPDFLYGQEYELTLDETDTQGVLEDMSFFEVELEKVDD